MSLRGLAWESACLLALLAACFGPGVWHDRVVAFRDSAHFYRPLYERVEQEWRAGRWPLWVPEVNGGTPLLANPTAAVFYPGKLAFRILPFEWALRAYAVGHVVLAYAAMRAFARRLGVSPTGAALAGQAFAFGGPVLFQVTNVVFLVGAAWAPLGFLGADAWAREGRRWGLVLLSAVLALQFLGGDPESAYLTAAAAAAYAAAVGASERWPSGRWPWVVLAAGLGAAYSLALLLAAAEAQIRAAQPAGTGGWAGASARALPWLAAAGLGSFVARQWLFRRGDSPASARVVGVAGSAALALAVAGVQLLPAVEYGERSLRASSSASPWQLRFSVPPQRLLEWPWPVVSGDVHRGNRAWGQALPPALTDSLWEPTLYAGGLTFVLALSAFGFRRGPRWRAWLSAVAVVSLLGAFGRFGSPLHWARFVPGLAASLGPHDAFGLSMARNDGFPADGVGSPYWFLCAWLPGFGTFRYPAKLLTFTTLALAALAGAGWDRLAAGGSRRVAAWAVAFLGSGLAAGAAVAAFRAGLIGWLTGRATGDMRLFGPLNAPGAVSDLLVALALGTAGMAAVLGLAALAVRRPKTAALVAPALLAVDLAISGAGLVWTVPRSVFARPPRVLEAVRGAERDEPSNGPFRVYHLGVGIVTPPAFAARNSWRFEDAIRWQWDALVPDYGVPLGVSYAYFESSTVHFDTPFFFDPFRVRLGDPAAAKFGPGLEPGRPVVYYPRRGLDLWGSRYFVLPSTIDWDDPHRSYASLTEATTPVDPGPNGFGEDQQVVRNDNAFPRAWIVHRARPVAPIVGNVRADRAELLREILYQDDPLWHDPVFRVHDPRLVAWVETDSPREVGRFLAASKPARDPHEVVRVERHEPQRVELDVTLNGPGLVVLADVFYPGWRLTVDGRPAEILRVNRLMRGALVDAGRHRLVYTFDPLSFRAGAGLSAAGLVTLAGLTLWGRRGRRASNPSSPP